MNIWHNTASIYFLKYPSVRTTIPISLCTLQYSKHLSQVLALVALFVFCLSNSCHVLVFLHSPVNTVHVPCVHMLCLIPNKLDLHVDPFPTSIPDVGSYVFSAELQLCFLDQFSPHRSVQFNSSYLPKIYLPQIRHTQHVWVNSPAQPCHTKFDSNEPKHLKSQ